MSNENVSQTVKNLEAAFAGESMANRKYLYFARECRKLGADEVADHFEETARQETAHAFGHLELLYPSATLTVEKMLQMADRWRDLRVQRNVSGVSPHRTGRAEP